jgi:hypothetical protein
MSRDMVKEEGKGRSERRREKRGRGEELYLSRKTLKKDALSFSLKLFHLESLDFGRRRYQSRYSGIVVPHI